MWLCNMLVDNQLITCVGVYVFVMHACMVLWSVVCVSGYGVLMDGTCYCDTRSHSIQ